MSLNLNKQKKASGVKQDIIEIGTYPARLVRVIDLGLQSRNPYKGQEKPPAYQVDLTYEMLDVFMVDKEGKEDETKPRWISETINLNNPNADLAISTKRAKALDPDDDHDFNLAEMVGSPCMVTIVHKESKGKTYANVGNVTTMRPKDAAKAPELVNEPVVFDLEEPNMEVFKNFPDWIQDKIKGNLEFNGSKLQANLGITAQAPDENQEEGEVW